MALKKEKEVLAIIPARGGSKSIPRKNIKYFSGHPLLAYSIASAFHSKNVTRVLVSTDDPEIAAIARIYGAEVPFLRPAALSRDDSTDYGLFVHAVNWLKKKEGYSPDLIMQLRPTSPLRPPGLVDAAIKMLQADSKADSVRTVTAPRQNPYKMWTQKREGYLKPLIMMNQKEPYNLPRQKLPNVFWQTGHIDVFRLATLVQKRSLTGQYILPLCVEAKYCVDIDTYEYWEFSEWLVCAGKVKIVQPRAVKNNPRTRRINQK